jgi:short-subunit dehydrogenase
VNVAVYDHDLSVPRAGTAVAERVAADGLTVDTQVNNAGMGTHGDFASLDPDAAVPIAAARFAPRRLVLAITGRAIGA